MLAQGYGQPKEVISVTPEAETVKDDIAEDFTDPGKLPKDLLHIPGFIDEYTDFIMSKDSKRAESLCPVSRVSGGEIESAVLLHIKKILCTPTIVNQLARDLNTPGKEVAEVLNKLTPLWDEMFPAERNRLMHLLLKKVTLYENHLDLDIRTAGVEQILEELDYEDHD